ncbi:Ref family recombination enhancement nuclease [Agrobacterium tumefaciens]|uniref:Ref family recombination enhancement nuclease n=1 Tax=Agrobacterium tumefaciens TaxID=358 RepID=UPI001571B061|nr:recombinase [Agrobacterium tumefaciens]
MKGKNVSAKQKKFHDLLAQHVGCQACYKDNGVRNTHVSIHHIDGRTKPGAHWKVLPVCAGHHQDGYGAPGMIAIHPYKARFEERYGRQLDLLAQAVTELRQAGHELPPEVLELTGEFA